MMRDAKQKKALKSTLMLEPTETTAYSQNARLSKPVCAKQCTTPRKRTPSVAIKHARGASMAKAGIRARYLTS